VHTQISFELQQPQLSGVFLGNAENSLYEQNGAEYENKSHDRKMKARKTAFEICQRS
jgi:hypothetical protein